MRKHRKTLILVVALVVVTSVAWAVYAGLPRTVTAFAATEKRIEDVFYEDGVVRAQTRASVSAEAGGKVVAVHVREGQAVRAGDLLLELSVEDLMGEKALMEAELEGVYAAWRQTQDQTRQQIAVVAAQKAAQSAADLSKWLDAQILSLVNALNPRLEGSVSYAFERMIEAAEIRGVYLLEQIANANEREPAEEQALRMQWEAAKAQSASISAQWEQAETETRLRRIEMEEALDALEASGAAEAEKAVYRRMLAALDSSDVEGAFRDMLSVADAQERRLKGALADAEARIPQEVEALNAQKLALESEKRTLEEQYSQMKQSMDAQILALSMQKEQESGVRGAQKKARAALDEQRALLEESMEQDSGTGAVYLAQVKRVEAGIAELDRRIGNARIVAPISGVVGGFEINIGDYLPPGAYITEVSDPESLMVECMVLTGDVDSIGQNGGISLVWERRDGDVTYEAAVESVSPIAVSSVSAVGLVEQRVKVLLEPKFSGDAPKDGYQLRVRFVTAAQNAVAVPRTALVKTEAGDGVFVAKDGKAELRAVSPGLTGGGEIAILDGISSGELVIADPKTDGVSEGDGVRVG